VETGERLKNLVPAHRLKKCNKNAATLYTNHPRLPLLGTDQVSHSQTDRPTVDTHTAAEATAVPIDSQQPDRQDDLTPQSGGIQFEAAIKILAQCKERNGPIMYLVLFADKSRYWADEVSENLLKQFRLWQEHKRQCKRKAYLRK